MASSPPPAYPSQKIAETLKSRLTSILAQRDEHDLPELLGISCIASDTSPEIPRLRILTESRTNPSDQAALKERISACFADSGEPFPELQFMAVGKISPLHGKGAHGHRQRPLCPGVAIAPARSADFGTMGMFLRDNQTGEPVFITAGHVLRMQGAESEGDPVFQPQGHEKHERIGTVISISPLHTRKGSTNLVDVAVVRPHKAFRNRMMRFSENRRRCYWNIAPRAAEWITPQDRLVKSGAASGFSGASARPSGFAGVVIDYANSTKQATKALFIDQIEIVCERGYCADGIIAVGGDSGSIVVRRESREVVGMIFAGSNGDSRVYYVTPIQNIMNDRNLGFL